MNATSILLVTLLITLALPALAVEPAPPDPSPDLDVRSARVDHLADLGLLVFELRVEGAAGGTFPEPAGQLDGAPVLGYVFPTTLRPEQVGFAPGEGIVALAATSHPDFDDTPLFDENGNGVYDDPGDGRVFHVHWVVLVPDERVAGGLSVKAVNGSAAETLPPTAPGMPIYLDSPGHTVVASGHRLRIVVPAWRIRGLESFRYDAVVAYMQVNTSDEDRPMLGVYQTYSVLSGDLSLPQTFSITPEGN
ncbi:MAG: hypothetical protein QNK05_15900 [Myxococcota bacterium]|nr:hypothetical protein [Myxococcota bacterium]